MATAQNKLIVQGGSEVDETYVKKEKRYFFFTVSWWVKINTEHIGDDLIIATHGRQIRSIILDGKVINLSDTKTNHE